ncbi:MAG: beta-galactosidase, partial [Bacteroidales bacterium]|nr:beta-galactosidase [Bacteroidales bacterium]
LPAGKAGRKLIVDEVNDWAVVFVDGKRIGSLDRRKAEKILELPATEKEAVLDILVENMGRVNYSKTIHDYKGITHKVSLQDGKVQKELRGFEIYPIPVEDALSSRLQFAPRSGKCTMPAYYKSHFNLDKTGDVYLDMQNWSKGLVWVNGYAIGRFWEIGPQQTLFVPGCWLKEGSNEIVVLDMQGPSRPVISGITTPILDMLRSNEEIMERNKNANPDESGYF